jgi:Holliday junction resolvasome RuvABC ATP-dependent DNA helicase subunit
MSRNHDYKAIVEQPPQIAIMDLGRAEIDAQIVNKIAAIQVDAVERLLAEEAQWIDETVEYQTDRHLMKGNLDQVNDEVLHLAEITNELAAQHSALLSVIKELLQQRDLILDRQRGEVVTQMAETGIEEDQARKLLSLLTTPDSELIEVDAIGAMVLDQYRDQVADLVAALDWDMQG